MRGSGPHHRGWSSVHRIVLEHVVWENLVSHVDDLAEHTCRDYGHKAFEHPGCSFIRWLADAAE